MKKTVFVLAFGLMVSPAFAQELNFDPAQLCSWQASNNGMDVGECTNLEEEAKASIAGLEGAADSDRKAACLSQAKSFSDDSGFASYTIYAGCLKDGPGSL